MSRFSSPTLVLPRDPRTVEASQALASFSTHATVQAVCEWRDEHKVPRTRLECTEADIADALATLGGDL